MTNKFLVKAIYRSAWCEKFYIGKDFPDQKFIVRYWPSPSKLRAEAIGWGSTRKKAWEDAADAIKVNMVFQLEK